MQQNRELPGFYRDTWAEIDMEAINGNIRELLSATHKDFIAVIKANGYGCGDECLARIAVECGAAYLAVSSLDEALSLRNKGIAQPILVLEYMNPLALHIARQNNITVTASSLDWVREAIETDITGLKVHVKYDTGMNRIGFKSFEELDEGIRKLQGCSVNIEGFYTHFACSDSEDTQMCEEQLAKFENVLHALKQPFRWIHCSNTDASFHFKENISNAVRCGIAMLGVSSHPNRLKPVISLYSKIVNIKQVSTGESIGYGATYHAKQDEWLATIPIGYADGWIRLHQGRCCVVDGYECEFVGRICMDQAMIRVPKAYPLGTVVELIGERMPIGRVAEELCTIPYEVMTLLSDRIAKVYTENNKEKAILNARLTNDAETKKECING